VENIYSEQGCLFVSGCHEEVLSPMRVTSSLPSLGVRGDLRAGSSWDKINLFCTTHNKIPNLLTYIILEPSLLFPFRNFHKEFSLFYKPDIRSLPISFRINQLKIEIPYNLRNYFRHFHKRNVFPNTRSRSHSKLPVNTIPKTKRVG
jgi:hypothetical protein